MLAGRRARALIEANGLRTQDVRAVAAAAGGPKGLALIPVDRWLFGEWLRDSNDPVTLAGASIGAWRMAAASQRQPLPALDRLQQAYLELQRYPEHPSAELVSEVCRTIAGEVLAGDPAAFVAGQDEHRRLAVITSRERSQPGKGIAHDPRVRFARAAVANALSRDRLGAHLQRVVFLSGGSPNAIAACPDDRFDTRYQRLDASNFQDALLASGSIPLVAEPVECATFATPGRYWDGGLVDYHLYWQWTAFDGIVLYPHFVPWVTAGWFDKLLRWRRHGVGAAGNGWLENVLLIVPSDELLARLPNGKLPDRKDFYRYGTDHDRRLHDWRRAIAECERMAQDLADFARRPDARRLEPI